MLNLRISDVIVVAVLIHLVQGKIFEKCELAFELRDNFVPFDRIGTFVCIAERQSNLNTASLGAGTFGLYQFSSEFWCDEGYAGKACGVQCSSLLDDDITDDIQCAQTVFDEHQRLFNNGFNAWPSSQFCQSQGNNFVQECFAEDNQVIKSFESYSRQEKTSGSVGEGKVYERCELARELMYQHDVAKEQIATWVCIAKHESQYNTAAIGRLNWDGSEDHGLFQISDIYWCGGYDGKACGLQCSELKDNDITDDVKCIKQIHAEHQRLSGDGFNAWTVYPRCKGQSASYIDGCFDDSTENEIAPYKPSPGIQQPKKPYAQPTRQERPLQRSSDTGKIYEKCELAQELRYKYKIPMEQVATWICIAKHESGFNTSAVGRLNADGSEDHGLFQISDIYWCSPPGTGTVCGVACSKFEDSDISDDVECMLKIFDEHTLISGDGFNAWTVYRPHCQGRSHSYIDGCFNQDDLKPKPAVTQPPKATTPWWVKSTEPPTTTTFKTRAPLTTTRTASTTSRPLITTTRATTNTSPRTTTPRTTTFAQTVTSRIIKSTFATLKPVTRTVQIKTSSLAPVTTKKIIEPTSIKATIKTTKPAITSSAKPTKTAKSGEKSPTAKSLNAFDLFFSSLPKGQSASDNEIQPQGKSVVYKTLKPSSIATTKTPKSSTKVYNQVSSQNAIGGQTTTRSTRNLGIPQSISSSIHLHRTSVSTGKTTLPSSQAKPTTKSTNVPKTTQKIISQSSDLHRKTESDAATSKPFNIYDFYLSGDYTSRSPIKYVPLQFSEHSTVIIKKDETAGAKSKASQKYFKSNFVSTASATTVRSLSIYNALDDDDGLKSNRIGRVVKNITPHSFDYLKTLMVTTPRTSANRA